jgi:hypothetical protein
VLHKTFNFYNSFVTLELKEKEKLAGLDILNNIKDVLEE